MRQILVPTLFFAILSILARLPVHNLYIDLLSHWPHLALIGGGGLAIFLLFLKEQRKKWVLWGLIALGVGANLFGIIAVPAPLGVVAAEAENRGLRIAYANLQAGNNRSTDFINWVKSESPDIIAVVELSPHWDTALQTAFPDYEPMVVFPRTDSFGIGLFARNDVENSELLQVDMHEITPMIRAVLEFDNGTKAALFVAHVLPPNNNHYYQARNQNFRHIQAILAAEDLPAIIVGDMNASPTSYAFQHELVTETLRPVAYRASWPSFLPDSLRVNIDHVLLEEGLSVSRLERGIEFGSDHLPLIIEVFSTNVENEP